MENNNKNIYKKRKFNLRMQRKPNFSESEDTALITAYFKRQKIIEGEFSSKLTMKDKRRSWNEVAIATNAADDRCFRDLGEVQNRFQTMFKAFKQWKRAQMMNLFLGEETTKIAPKKPYFNLLEKYMKDDVRITGGFSFDQIKLETLPGEEPQIMVEEPPFQCSSSYDNTPALWEIEMGEEDLGINNSLTTAPVLPPNKKGAKRKNSEETEEAKQTSKNDLKIEVMEKNLEVLRKQERNLDLQEQVLKLKRSVIELKLKRMQRDDDLSGNS